MGAGKSTFADMMVDNIRRAVANPLASRSVHRMSLAEPLKTAVSNIWGIDGFTAEKEVPIDIGLDKPITTRRLLQLFGTAGVRQGFGLALEAEGYAAPGDSCVWARALLHRAQAIAQKTRRTTYVVVDDVRFPDELDAFIRTAPLVMHIHVSRRVDAGTENGGYVSERPMARRSPDPCGANGARFFTYEVDNDSLQGLRDAAHTWSLLFADQVDRLPSLDD